MLFRKIFVLDETISAWAVRIFKSWSQHFTFFVFPKWDRFIINSYVHGAGKAIDTIALFMWFVHQSTYGETDSAHPVLVQLGSTSTDTVYIGTPTQIIKSKQPEKSGGPKFEEGILVMVSGFYGSEPDECHASVGSKTGGVWSGNKTQSTLTPVGRYAGSLGV